MKKICSLTGQEFQISEAEGNFCEKYSIPLPTICPAERLRQQLFFRNRLFLYNSKCDFSGQKVLSCVPPQSNRKIYEIETWESDRWDVSSYAQDYDFSRPFFEQFAQLVNKAPWPNLTVIRSSIENSDYCNGANHMRNCYLVFCAHTCEDCFFSKYINRCRSLFECCLCFDCELCFDSRNLANCYNLAFSENCSNCSDSAFLYNCSGCSNCFACVNMNNKQNYFLNQAYSPEEYARKIREVDLGSRRNLAAFSKKFEDFRKSYALRYLVGKRNEESTGNYLNNTRYCYDCFFVNDGEELENCIWVDGAKNSFFYTMWGERSELLYSVVSSGHNAFNLKFCSECWKGAQDLEYCMFTGYGSTNCFGCFGLKKRSYCILNKQYNKQQYHELVARVKAHMNFTGEYGKFFPTGYSPFYYNQSDVIEFFPLAKEQALKKGYAWLDEEPAEYSSSYKVPDHISEVRDDILEQQLSCEVSKKKYKIIKAELEFYRANGLPIPRIAPFERLKRMGEMAQIKPLRHISCDDCGAEIKTMHSGPQKIYCESCYQACLQ